MVSMSPRRACPLQAPHKTRCMRSIRPAMRTACFPQHLWMPCGRACGKRHQVIDGAGMRDALPKLWSPVRWAHAAARRRRMRDRREVFHSICGCHRRELVEKTSKSLTRLCHARAARCFVTAASCGVMFSTAAVDAACTSLWTRRAVRLGDKHLACVGDVFASAERGASRGFSTASVDARWASLWTSRAMPFGGRHLLRDADVLRSKPRASGGFPQRLWSGVGEACG